MYKLPTLFVARASLGVFMSCLLVPLAQAATETVAPTGFVQGGSDSALMWKPSTAGSYKVWVQIPDFGATTNQAVYWVSPKGLSCASASDCDKIVIDQTANSGKWLQLMLNNKSDTTWSFTTSGRVLADAFDVPDNQFLSIGQVKFEQTDSTPTPNSPFVNAIESPHNDTADTATIVPWQSNQYGKTTEFFLTGGIGDNYSTSDIKDDWDLFKISVQKGDRIDIKLNRGGESRPLFYLFDSRGYVKLSKGLTTTTTTVGYAFTVAGDYYLLIQAGYPIPVNAIKLNEFPNRWADGKTLIDLYDVSLKIRDGSK